MLWWVEKAYKFTKIIYVYRTTHISHLRRVGESPGSIWRTQNYEPVTSLTHRFTQSEWKIYYCNQSGCLCGKVLWFAEYPPELSAWRFCGVTLIKRSLHRHKNISHIGNHCDNKHASASDINASCRWKIRLAVPFIQRISSSWKTSNLVGCLLLHVLPRCIRVVDKCLTVERSMPWNHNHGICFLRKPVWYKTRRAWLWIHCAGISQITHVSSMVVVGCSLVVQTSPATSQQMLKCRPSKLPDR